MANDDDCPLEIKALAVPPRMLASFYEITYIFFLKESKGSPL